MGSKPKASHYEKNTCLPPETETTMTDNQYDIIVDVPTLSRNVDDRTSPEQIHLKPLPSTNRIKRKKARNRKGCRNVFVVVVTILSIVAACVTIAGFVMSRKNAVDGGWTIWSSWGYCSVTCGSGTQARTRTCNNPFPSHSGQNCSGSSRDSRSCGTSCGVLGGWSTWMPWTDCSRSCGSGLTHRRRRCNNPTPSERGKYCYGDPVEYAICEVIACAGTVGHTIDGGWSIWSSWGYCSVTCGSGTQSRTRTCNNPFPSHNGQNCSGSSRDSRSCGTSCGVNGGWSSWGSWTSCKINGKAFFGPGVRKRYRYCNNPYPSGRGRACIGNSIEAGSCIVTTSFSSGDMRISGGPSPSFGRLEVKHNGAWGTVCDDSWDGVAATVACKQLGFGSSMRWNGSNDINLYGPGSGTIWLDNVDCTGDESFLWDCSHSGWGSHDCDHSEDVGIHCLH